MSEGIGGDGETIAYSVDDFVLEDSEGLIAESSVALL